MGYRSGIAVSCGVGHGRGLDPTLLWLWGRPVASALVQPLAWEPPYAMGVDLKRQKTKRKKEKKKKLALIKGKLGSFLGYVCVCGGYTCLFSFYFINPF